MKTEFSLAQLADPRIAEADKILRTCVHCGFCTATCPTFALLGDELDSPRGRIYLIKDMLENERPATPEVVKHVDRCLSCLSCMTTCPSGVHYMHLVDHARDHIEQTYRRPFFDRLNRAVLAAILPYRQRFRLALLAGVVAKPLAPLFAAIPPLKPVAAMLRLAQPPHGRSASEEPGSHPPQGERTGRVALLAGCAQPALRPEIDEAAIRLLTRNGVEVVRVKGEGCCGSLVHHLGREEQASALAKANIDAWIAEMDGPGLDAIVVTVSGCGTSIKDYGHVFRLDPAYAEKAARVSAIAMDITEYVAGLGLPAAPAPMGLKVAYHAACSLQHGQKIKGPPVALLKAAGFTVVEPFESHLCCGSAGTYNMLQSDLAARLRDRKVGHLERLAPDLIAAGNIGCMTQIGSGTQVPVVHTVELLDWAHGGPRPAALAHVRAAA
ncbi:glycolate oxidase subunit GlcF [Aquabacter sp. L1I39]|uniref:glycolate oxidase subunit GlcF n=1 Tax=Aquabacter sp. L1I39 TaxID=2820278 RepID=UPI001ADD002F|nr:glycolate oxidase subunit GlcF [Aquabacter sp. L1I39]QTL02728.1 glycolate oxidase subunit GlcF [Aquabacter sp. L1I39]